MANEIIREIVKSKIIGLINDGKSISGIDHNYLKGQLREIFIDKLFTPLLTKGFKCGTGKIVDFTGNQSSEIDLLIYNTNFLPSFLFTERLGVFPVESCFYAFEVKTKTNATEIKDTIQKFRRLDEFNFLKHSNLTDEPNFFKGVSLRKVLIAFESDLTNKTELERCEELDPEAKTNPAIDIIIVLNKEYSFFSNGTWFLTPQADEVETLIYFITGLLNSLPPAFSQRQHPDFGWYLVETDITKRYKGGA